MSLATVFVLNQLPADNKILMNFGRLSTATSLTRGIALGLITADRIRGAIKEDGGGTISTPLYAFSAGDVGKIHTFVMTWDASTLRLYHNGSEVGAGTSFSGTYEAASSGDQFWLSNGFTAASIQTPSFNFIGVSLDSSNAMSSGQVSTWDADCEASADGIVALPTGGILWKAATWDGSTGSDVWDDESATYPLSTNSGNEAKIQVTPEWA